MPFSFKKT